MQIHHKRHVMWISALTLSALGCAAGQSHSPSEAAAAGPSAAPSTSEAAGNHESQWAASPGESGEFHPGQRSEEEMLPVVQALAPRKQRSTRAEHGLPGPAAQGGSGNRVCLLLQRPHARVHHNRFSRSDYWITLDFLDECFDKCFSKSQASNYFNPLVLRNTSRL